MRQHSPSQQFREAKQIARDHGMFVVEKPGRFLLYRQAQPKNTCLGYRSDIAAFRVFVERCAYGK